MKAAAGKGKTGSNAVVAAATTTTTTTATTATTARRERSASLMSEASDVDAADFSAGLDCPDTSARKVRVPSEASARAMAFVADAVRGKRLVVVRVPAAVDVGVMDGVVLSDGSKVGGGEWVLRRDDAVAETVVMRAPAVSTGRVELFTFDEGYVLARASTQTESEEWNPIQRRKRRFAVPPTLASTSKKSAADPAAHSHPRPQEEKVSKRKN